MTTREEQLKPGIDIKRCTLFVSSSEKAGRRGFGRRFAKEVGMGDPAEENDPSTRINRILEK